MRARSGFRLPKEAIAVAALVILLLVPRFVDVYWLALALDILKYVALATAWAFFSGPTRYVTLAASAFFGVGAYTVAVLTDSSYAVSYPLALLAAVAISVLLSALVGLATLRLSGMYFVIFTFGLASLVSAAATWWEFNVAKSAGWYPNLPMTEAHIYYQLLALCIPSSPSGSSAIAAAWALRSRRSAPTRPSPARSASTPWRSRSARSS